jgi:hypothetical protein
MRADPQPLSEELQKQKDLIKMINNNNLSKEEMKKKFNDFLKDIK